MHAKGVVITGASSGIGRSTAALLHSSGFQIINAGRKAPENNTLIRYVPCDITKREDIDALYTTAKGQSGVPDALISNAGAGVHEKLAEGDPEECISGYHQDGHRNVNMQLWNWKGLDIIIAHERSPHRYKEGIKEAIKAIIYGSVDPDRLLTHFFDFEDMAQELDVWKECQEGFIKGYIKF